MSNEMSYPMIPVRGQVLFPFCLLRFKVGRPLSISALNQAIASDQLIFIGTQHDGTIENPTFDQIYRTGVIAKVTNYEEIEDGEFKVEIQTLECAEAISIEEEKCWQAKVIRIAEPDKDDLKISELFIQLKQYLTDNLDTIENKKLSNTDNLRHILEMDNPTKFSYAIASNLAISLEDKQRLLETPSLADRLTRVLDLIKGNIEQV